MITHLFSFIVCIAAAYTELSREPEPKFPNIDLGYAVHAVTSINITASGLQIANYNNIRYAQPPTGKLRFRKPATPPPHAHGILNGTEYISTDCVSSAPSEIPFPGINGTYWGSEDCLFLNVQVPEGVKEGDNLPVIHWIHGSAYAFGSKDNYYTRVDAFGLFDRASEVFGEKFIFVASNYR
jgi:carboxylesterase type B